MLVPDPNPFLLLCRPVVDSETTPTRRVPSSEEIEKRKARVVHLYNARDKKTKEVLITSYADLVVELEPPTVHYN